MEISIQKNGISFIKNENLLIASERNVAFATTYFVKNEKTGNRIQFDFSHSTGPEFDENTRWIYVANSIKITTKLAICNDKIMTKIAANNYLAHKLNR